MIRQMSAGQAKNGLRRCLFAVHDVEMAGYGF
jgi:hypothetical protein